METKPSLYFYETHEFKGRLIKPSKGRIDFAIAAGVRLGGENPITHVDILILIYCCICEESILMYAQRDPGKFLQLVMAWREQEVSDEDLVTLAEVAKRILEGATSTQAEPIHDPSHLPDPVSN